MKFCSYYILFFFLFACYKPKDRANAKTQQGLEAETGYKKYLIRQGQHFSNYSVYKAIETDELKFFVSFDSSAIYHSAASINQYDINKLYGFSDNEAHHHQYSA